MNQQEHGASPWVSDLFKAIGQKGDLGLLCVEQSGSYKETDFGLM